MQSEQKPELTDHADKVVNVSIFSSSISDNTIFQLHLSYKREYPFSPHLIHSS